MPPLKDGSGTYAAYNPSIIKTDLGYDMICRTSNLTKDNWEGTGGEVRRNRGFFLRYDKSFNLLGEQEIKIPTHLVSDLVTPNLLLMDYRLFDWNGASWFSSWFYLKGKERIQKFSACKLDGSQDVIPTTIESFTYFGSQDVIPTMIESFTHFTGPTEKRWEKNWLHIPGDTLRFIYIYDPFVIVEANIESGETQTVFTYKPSLDFTYFHGSAAPVEFEDGYLAMVHETHVYRSYTHRFVFMDKNFVITKLSLPFTFTHVGVEMCLAMTIDHSGKKLVIPFGIEDVEAKIAIVDLEQVKKMLIEVSSIEASIAQK